MVAIDFSNIRNLKDLSLHLSFDEDTLRGIIESKNQTDFYRKMYIPKKNRGNGYRIVYKANDLIEVIHKTIASSVRDIKFPDYVQGYVRGNSIVSNASKHLSKFYLLHIDIVNFFESISYDKVNLSFKKIGCNDEISDYLSKLCTVDKILVQGLSTSPTISNIACAEMDEDLFNLCSRYDSKYTRYSDDITISSNTVLPSKKEVENLLSKYGFSLNHKKYKVMTRGQKQYVTGLTVFDNERPRIAKSIKKNLRLELYYANKYGIEKHFQKNNIDEEFAHIRHIEGWIIFMFGVEPIVAKRFRDIWKPLIKEYEKNNNVSISIIR